MSCDQSLSLSANTSLLCLIVQCPVPEAWEVTTLSRYFSIATFFCPLAVKEQYVGTIRSDVAISNHTTLMMKGVLLCTLPYGTE